MRPAPARRTTTEARRHRGQQRPPDLLTSVARLVHGIDEHPGHLLVHATDPDGAVDLGFSPVEPGVHPFDVVAGLTAPTQWWAFGIRARGRAHHLDEPAGSPEPMVVTYLIARDGTEASCLGVGGRRVTEPPGPAVGTIADLCRRVLQLPTEPAPATTSLLWTTTWLDRLMTAWGDPSQRRELGQRWSAVGALHPAVAGQAPAPADPEALVALARAHTETWTWERLRHAPEAFQLPDGPLDTEVAAWMDDGFFARWTIGAFPPAAELSTELRGLLGATTGDQLVATVQALHG